MRLTVLFKEFFKSESAGGVILIICTVVSLLLANLFLGDSYVHFWHLDLLNKPVHFWVNDVLMTIFFLLVGLEIEREIYIGELSNIKNALLPIAAAAGGMLVPAGIYILFNISTGSIAGFGIPMATDIAFAVGVLGLLSSRVPASLKVFLIALAIIDDIGAIIIIGIFYTSEFGVISFLIALGIFLVLILFNRLGIKNLLFYFIPGIAMWIFLYQSGIHPTITGILLAFAIPFGKGDNESMSYKLQHYLHKPVAYAVLPIFALANTGLILNAEDFLNLSGPNNLGIMLGLLVGKPLGILLFTWLAVKSKLSQMFEDLNWKHILGAGMVAGIGFTMSIFITLLAFSDDYLIKTSKLAVFIASLISAVAGLLFLRFTGRNTIVKNNL